MAKQLLGKEVTAALNAKLQARVAELKEKGVRLIDQTPRYGAGGARIAFLHPKATHGVLLELCERK